LSKLEASRYKRKQLIIPANDHEYRSGFPHICEPHELVVRSPHATLVLFLQNDAGFLRWGPTPERVDAFLESFKPGKEMAKEKELSLLSPPPTPQPLVLGSQPAAISNSSNNTTATTTNNNNNNSSNTNNNNNSNSNHHNSPLDGTSGTISLGVTPAGFSSSSNPGSSSQSSLHVSSPNVVTN
jgi:hypothetical protein